MTEEQEKGTQDEITSDLTPEAETASVGAEAVEADGAAEQAGEDSQAENPASAAKKKARPHRKRNIIITVCVVLVLACAGVFACFAQGIVSPANAAAKYNLLDYIYEDEVTDYIETYKTQMGYGDASDEEWATFLAYYNMTPERLRASTIDQLLTNKIIEQKCSELGITVSDDELDSDIQSYKDSYASGSDDIWTETLGQFGQTEEGFRESRRLELLKEKLCENQVAKPEASDDQVKSTIATYIDNLKSNERSLTLKHSYCFKKSKSASEGSLEEREEVEKIRQGLLDVGASEESFASIVQLYSDDESLKQSNGANGWDADRTGYSEEYVKALDATGKNGVSSVYADDECYFFIWVSDTYKLPKNSSKAEDIDLSKMPDALHQYFSDVAAYALWQTDAQNYLLNITNDVNVVYFSMPSDVPYNVDMSLAQTGDGASDGSDSSSGDSSASSADSSSSASDSSASSSESSASSS